MDIRGQASYRGSYNYFKINFKIWISLKQNIYDYLFISKHNLDHSQ